MRSPKTAALAVAAGLAAVPALALVPTAGATPGPCTVHDTTTGHLATYTGTGALQAAVNAATPADALAVSGTCAGDTAVTKHLTISGPATLSGTGTPGSVVTIAHGVSASLAGLDITGGTGNFDVNGYAPITFGGGIDNEGRLALTNVTVAGNTAGNGGGIFNDVGATLSLGGTRGTSVSADLATGRGGGGIYNYKGTVTSTNAGINHDTAVGTGVIGGGGIFNDDGKVVLGSHTTAGTSVSWNSAPDGAGIDNYGTGSHLTITNGRVNRNAAIYIGGGIKNWAGNAATLIGTSVDANTARYGAGLYSDGPLALRSDAVNGNSAGVWGGGIFNDVHGSLSVVATTIHGNHAASVGGGIASDAPATLIGDTIGANTSGAGGGGIYSSHTTLTLTRTSVTRNTAPRGGGIYAWGVGKVRLRVGATVTRNRATVHKGGGGIFYFSGTALVGVSAGHNVRLNVNGNVVA